MLDQITKARIAFISSNHYSIMTVSAPLTLKGSESFILSLAEFLEEVVKIPPPNIAEYIIESHHPTTEEYFGPWCDHLFTLLQKKKYMEDNGEILFLSTITYEYYQKNLMNNSFFRSEKLEGENAFQIGEQLRRSFGSTTKSEVSKKTKKIAIINFSASVANLDRLKPKIHLQGLYSGQLYRPGDEWHSYRILNNDIPSEQQINNHNVIILTGSSYSVNNLCPQVCGFTHNLSKSLIANKRLKILATCFGHQLLSWMHGSSIISKNLIKGTQQVNFSTQKKALDLPFLEQIANDHNRLKLYEYHNDYVVSVPKGFIKVCESQSCGIQSLVSLDQRIWTFQFHPQYTAQYIKSYEMRQAHYLHKDYAESKISCDQKHHQSMRMVRRAMRKFIDMQDK